MNAEKERAHGAPFYIDWRKEVLGSEEKECAQGAPSYIDRSSSQKEPEVRMSQTHFSSKTPPLTTISLRLGMRTSLSEMKHWNCPAVTCSLPPPRTRAVGLPTGYGVGGAAEVAGV